MPEDTHGPGGKTAGEEAAGQGEAIDRRLNTAGERAADPPFENDGEVKQGEHAKRGEDCDESPPIPSQRLANVLGEGSSPIVANTGLERTSTSSAEPAVAGKI